MAESNQRKIADPVELNDEDPFAELTRIMGFDPRVAARAPVKEAAKETSTPKPQPAAIVTPLTPRVGASVQAPKSVAHDDFAIDLEKELLGEFADFDAPEIVEPSTALAAMFRAPVVAEPVASEASIAASTNAAQHDAGVDYDFDDAFAAALDDLPVVTADVQPANGVAQPIDVLAQPEYKAAYDQPVQDPAVGDETYSKAETQPEAAVADFDLDDFALDDSHIEQHVAEQIADDLWTAQPAQDLAPVAQMAGEVPAYETQVDDGFADVDMDFAAEFDREFAADADVEGKTAPAASLADEPIIAKADVAVDRAPEQASVDHPEFDLGFEDELVALLDAEEKQQPQQAMMPMAPSAPALAAAAAPAAAAKPSQPQFDERWAALEADDEEESVRSGSQSTYGVFSVGRPDERVADTRRPYSDPSLVARHANFQAAPAPQPVEDLDDLIEAMEQEVHGDHPPVKAEAAPQPVSEPAASVPFTSGFASYGQPPQHSYEEKEPVAVTYQAAPEIETIDVPERAVAVTDDLDIPELAYEEDEQPVTAYDDIDAEFSAAFQDNSLREEPVNQVVRGSAAPAEHLDFDADFEALYRPAHAADNRGVAQSSRQYAHETSQPAGNHRSEARLQDFDDFDETEQSLPPVRDRFVDLDFDNEVDEDLIPDTAYQAQEQARRPRRGILIAALVGSVALLGGVGALALSLGGGETSNTPVVVKADDGPIKVRPENPGGSVVPNQDNKVYDAVKGTSAAADGPAQKKLVTTSEEPVDMAAVEESDALPGLEMDDDVVAKTEFRVDPKADADQAGVPAESVAVAPRKVKTMVVRSDGTLVAREDNEPAPAANDNATDMASAAPAEPVASSDETTGTAVADQDGPTFQSPGADPVPVKPVKTEAAVAPEPDEVTETASALPPANTAEEPAAAEPKEEAKPEEQVASVEPTAVATGAWSVQIASQPSAESAKSTYQDLAKRYGKVIGGRGVNIVKAEIAGKGTYWRVRVPAKSRDEAVQLCGDYKAAGGNCFVSK